MAQLSCALQLLSTAQTPRSSPIRPRDKSNRSLLIVGCSSPRKTFGTNVCGLRSYAEPRRLHLHHDAVARQEHVIRRRQGELVRQRCIYLDRLRILEARAIASAEDVHRDPELVAAHLGLAGDFVGIDVDQLHDPVGVGAARGRHQMHDRRAADTHGLGQHRRHVAQDIGTIGDEALIHQQPAAPGVAVDEPGRPRDERHGLGRIRDVLVVAGG